jgi:RNA polymerase sigma-70 factor (ECF subfamily)
MLGEQPETEMTQMATEWAKSRRQSVPELFELMYKDLRKIARAYMRKERPDHTLQTTALINEAYLRIFQGSQPVEWKSEKHLLCVMAQAMRRILIDHARIHACHKRGGEHRKISLEDVFMVSDERSPELLTLHEAVERLAKLEPRQGQVVDLRFFAGLTAEETAAIVGVSAETVKLDWRFAKAWLQREIGISR